MTATNSIKFMTVGELSQLPPPDWLVAKTVEANSHVVLFGPPSAGKSFVALDVAASIASGRDWANRRVKRGDVVYIASEGGRGALKRIRAWMIANGVSEMPGMFFFLGAIQFHRPDQVEAFKAALSSAGVRPRLIVIDTLARNFVGGDENAAADMGRWIDGVERIRKDLNATVITIHHSRKTTGNKPAVERGHSSLRGAADTLISVVRKEESVEVRCEKQKDEECFARLLFSTAKVEVGRDEHGAPITSLVLQHRGHGPQSLDHTVGLNPSELRALQVLSAFPSGASSKDWKTGIGPNVSDKTFNNWRQALVEKGHVELTPGRTAGHYQVTAKGQATANGLPFSSQQGNPSAAMPATTPLGVAGDGKGIEKQAA